MASSPTRAAISVYSVCERGFSSVRPVATSAEAFSTSESSVVKGSGAGTRGVLRGVSCFCAFESRVRSVPRLATTGKAASSCGSGAVDCDVEVGAFASGRAGKSTGGGPGGWVSRDKSSAVGAPESEEPPGSGGRFIGDFPPAAVPSASGSGGSSVGGIVPAAGLLAGPVPAGACAVAGSSGSAGRAVGDWAGDRSDAADVPAPTVVSGSCGKPIGVVGCGEDPVSGTGPLGTDGIGASAGSGGG